MQLTTQAAKEVFGTHSWWYPGAGDGAGNEEKCSEALAGEAQAGDSFGCGDCEMVGPEMRKQGK